METLHNVVLSWRHRQGCSGPRAASGRSSFEMCARWQHRPEMRHSKQMLKHSVRQAAHGVEHVAVMIVKLLTPV